MAVIDLLYGLIWNEVKTKDFKKWNKATKNEENLRSCQTKVMKIIKI
jgi:hypothetical protein